MGCRDLPISPPLAREEADGGASLSVAPAVATPLLAIGHRGPEAVDGARGVVERGHPSPVEFQALRFGGGQRLTCGTLNTHGEDKMLPLIVNDEHPAAIRDGLGKNTVAHIAPPGKTQDSKTSVPKN